jgi:hypothetical protein
MVHTFNEMVKCVYSTSLFPHQSREALQYSVILGRGYLWPQYIRKDFGWGDGGIEFASLGPREVLPTQLPSNGDMQGAYAQTICTWQKPTHGFLMRKKT